MLCISATYAVIRCLSVCVSVTFVNSVKTSNHIVIFHSLVATPFCSSIPNVMAMFRRECPLTGASNVGWGRHESLLLTNSCWLSIDDVLDLRTSATVHRAVCRADGDASVKLYLSQLATSRPRRREENRTESTGTQRQI